MKVSIVIPVYNEEESLREFIAEVNEEIKKIPYEYEIIFIDDGSCDSSFEVLGEIKQKYDNVKVIKFKRNFGQTAAISAGFDHAEGDVIITMDADLQNDPKDIPLLLEEINNGYDVVSGWRKNRKDDFLTRRLPSNIANKIISWYTGVKLNDYGCTLKAYKKDMVKNINLYGELHRFIPALMSWSGARIKEVVVTHHPRRYGRSKYNLSRTINVILDLLTVKFLLSSRKGPMQVFGKIGLVYSVLGFLAAMITVINKVCNGIDMTGNPLLYLSVFFIFVGIQFISIGLLGEINIRTYSESRQKKIYSIREII